MKNIVESPEKLDEKELEQKVKSMYRKVALHPEEKYHFEMGRTLAERLGYPAHMLDLIPPDAIESFAGVGYYFDLANLRPGEVVVDLGSGSGMDTFYAALEVGKTGEVIGIDMTDEQIHKANSLRDSYHFDQVVFHKNYIEQPPIVSGSVDAVISNGVINLSSQKEKVFQEAARILKPGGRFVFSDIVTRHRLSENIKCDTTLWAACIGGAEQLDEYFELIEKAGFTIVSEKDNPYEFISKSAQGATREYGIKSISICAVKY